MVFNWFDATKAKEFGESLAHFFVEQVPRNDQIKEKKFAFKTQRVLEKMQLQILRFKLENKMNTYKKAQLGNSFKWALKDAGFAPAYIEKLTEWLMLQIS